MKHMDVYILGAWWKLGGRMPFSSLIQSVELWRLPYPPVMITEINILNQNCSYTLYTKPMGLSMTGWKEEHSLILCDTTVCSVFMMGTWG